jgi:hypothetical protein
MRAKEFTINVPITISISGDNDPVVSTSGEQSSSELQQNPVMVSPQQQELELAKAELGKESPVIDKLTQNDNIGAEPEQTENVILSRIKQLMAR